MNKHVQSHHVYQRLLLSFIPERKGPFLLPDVVWFLHNSPKMESIMAEKKKLYVKTGPKGKLSWVYPLHFLGRWAWVKT